VSHAPTTTRLLLARHGQTDANAGQVFQGQTGGPLNEVGRTQAEKLAKRLRTSGASIVYASDLLRAVETATFVADALGVPLREDRTLREVDVGAWSGVSLDDVKRRFPEEYAAWHAGIDIRRGGGETYGELAHRLRRAVVSIAAAHPGQTVVVVSHGAALRALGCSVLGIEPPGPKSLAGVRNTALAEIVAEEGSLRLLSWNDAAHLEGW
jgi:probable phosphoglycerate mutase